MVHVNVKWVKSVPADWTTEIRVMGKPVTFISCHGVQKVSEEHSASYKMFITANYWARQSPSKNKEAMEGILMVDNPPICNCIWVRLQDLRAPYPGLCNSERNDVIYVFLSG
jgi:hypothetical protein